MDRVRDELQRVADNATSYRFQLQVAALKKSARRKKLTIAAGILALTSAAAITTVVTQIFGAFAVQVLAALVAAVSGTTSVLVNAYYGDDTVLTMLLGSSKYLALRDEAYLSSIRSDLSESERLESLQKLQTEYARLDETFSKYFSTGMTVSQRGPGPRSVEAKMWAVRPELPREGTGSNRDRGK